MVHRRARIGLILTVAVLLGAAREWLFLNLNYTIDHRSHDRPYSYAHSAFTKATSNLNLGQLLSLKWTLALVFIGAMLLLSVVLARLLFGDHRHLRTVIIGFLTIGTLAALLEWIGRVVHPAFGDIAVKLLHMVQYPVVLLFLWAGAMLSRRTA